MSCLMTPAYFLLIFHILFVSSSSSSIIHSCSKGYSLMSVVEPFAPSTQPQTVQSVFLATCLCFIKRFRR
jgi:hypothetical protein